MHSVPAAIRRGGGPTHSIGQSLMMDRETNPYLQRTPSVAGNILKWSVSFWLKPGAENLSSPFVADNSSNYGGGIRLSGGVISIYQYTTVYAVAVNTGTILRDPSAHYNIIVHYDAANAVTEDRVIVFLNNKRITEYDTTNYPSTGEDIRINRAGVKHQVGATPDRNGRSMDGYVSQFAFFDDHLVDPNTTGEWHPECPQIWCPVDITDLDYSGTNSFLLNFEDPLDIGKDVSGNANNHTTSGIVAEDIVTDSPTNNACVLNSADKDTTQPVTKGNRYVNSTGSGAVRGTIWPTSGKWYFETKLISMSARGQHFIGVGTVLANRANWTGYDVYGWCISGTGTGTAVHKYTNASGTTLTDTAAWVADGIVQVAWDADTGELWFGYDGNWLDGDPATGTTPAFTEPEIAGQVAPMPSSSNAAADYECYFNEDEFTYTPPTGFNALMNKYLPVPVIKDPKEYFDPVIYTGNATPRTITTQNKVDHVVIKNRSQADEWKVVDSVRGATKHMSWDSSNEEATEVNGVTALGASSGFDLGTGAAGYNDNNEDFVAYPFTKSPIAGMDIVTYIGNGTVLNVSHNLGVIPEMFWVKKYGQAPGYNWNVYHEAIGNTKQLFMDTSSASSTTSAWNNTSPTSSVFTVGNATYTNTNGHDYIAYLFASVEGFIKVFTYTGNGNADGPFVSCGFKPAFVLTKKTNATDSWHIIDIKRNEYNPAITALFPDVPAAESDNWGDADLNSNGFKIRRANVLVNDNGSSYIGIALPEYPYALLNNSG